MIRVSCTMFLVVVEFLWILRVSRADSQVSCIFMERCILPCSFHGSSEPVVHWFKTEGNLRVHSYYGDQDQLVIQHQRFRSRTSLSKDQVSRGNASLQLTEVNIQDEGRYQCHTSTISGNTEMFIILNVDAPVRKVDLQQVGQRITCSSEGIYPKPEITWSTYPSSSITNNKTTVHQTEQQLYNITSSPILPNSDMDLNYSCVVSTRRNRKSATFRQQGLVTESQSETIIHCSPSHTPVTNLIWRFDHSQIILTKTNSQYTVSEEWKQHVKDVSESGSLTLQDLSSDQEGTYTCELADAVEAKITNILVKINEGNSSNVGAIVGVVIAVIVVLGLLVTLLVLRNNQVTKNVRKLSRVKPEHD
uniref:Ig-like domain-containing protein n=1 Tax=Astatotilapia calliptera TaxID=8154 RepID=A0A3P8PVD2_ASTCA